MPTHLLRPLSLSLLVLTLAGIGLLSARDTWARPQVADFVATRSPREAAAIVREAQARDAVPVPWPCG